MWACFLHGLSVYTTMGLHTVSIYTKQGAIPAIGHWYICIYWTVTILACPGTTYTFQYVGSAHVQGLRCRKCGFNSLWPSDTLWRQRSGSTLAQVMVVAWRHQAITWTNVDWSSVKSSDIHIRTISQEMPEPSITKVRLKITLKILFRFPRGQWVNTMTIYKKITWK